MKQEIVEQYLDMMNQWMILKQNGTSIETYLSQNGIHSIAVYGMGIYGRHVVRELLGTNIKIVYCIDMKQMKPYKGISVIQATNDMPKVDAIINSIIYEQDYVKSYLEKFFDGVVISIEDIIFDLAKEVLESGNKN